MWMTRGEFLRRMSLSLMAFGLMGMELFSRRKYPLLMDDFERVHPESVIGWDMGVPMHPNCRCALVVYSDGKLVNVEDLGLSNEIHYIEQIINVGAKGVVSH